MADFNAHVVLSAKNNAGAPLRQLRNDLRGLAESFRGLGRTTGLRDLQRDFVNLGRTVGDIHRRHILPMMRSVASIGGMLGGLTAGAAVVGLSRSMDNARQSIDNFSKASRRINMPLDDLRAYGHVADLAGISTQEFTGGMVQANRTFAQMQAGIGRANSRLKELNPTLRTQMLGAKSATEAVDLALQAMHGAIQSGDRGMASELSATIFGGDFTALAEMSAKEFRDAYVDAMKLIGPIGTKAGVEIENFNDRFSDLTASIIGTRDALAAELLPSLTPIVQQWTEWLSPKNRGEFVKSIAEPIKAMVKWLNEVNWKAVGEGFKQVGSGIASVASAIKSLADAAGGWDKLIIGLVALKTANATGLTGALASGGAAAIGAGAGAAAASGVLPPVAAVVALAELARRAIASTSASAQRQNLAPPAKNYSQGDAADRDNHYREWNGVQFEGGMHRAGRGFGPKASIAAAMTTSAQSRLLNGLKGVLDRIEKLFKSMPLGAGFGPMGSASSLGGSAASFASVRDAVRGGNISLPGGAAPGGTGGRTPGKGFFEAIIAAEGTAVKGDPYEEVLGYGAYGRPDKPLTGMTLNEVKEFGLSMRRAQTARGKPWNKTSSASGAFQIVGTTMMDAARALGMDPETTKFDQATQQRMATWIAQKQGLGAWEGFKHHPQQRAAAAAAMAAGVDPSKAGTASGALAPLSDANQGAIRSQKATAELEAAIREGVAKVYGDGYSAQIYSGGQNPLGVGGPRTGSTRHDGGKAADLYVIGPDGQRVRGDQLAKLGQHWAATGQGGVGLEMRGGGIHLDQHKDRAKHWNYAAKGGSYTPGQRAAMEAGLAGIPPEYAPRSATASRSLRPNMNRRSFTPATREQGYRAAEVPSQKVEVGKGALDIRLSLPDGVGVSNIGVKQPENLTANVGVDRTGAFRPPSGTKTGMRGPT